MLVPVGVSVTVVLAQANAPVPSTWLGSRISMTLELSDARRPVAASGPSRRPCPKGMETTLGGTAGVGYTGTRMEVRAVELTTTTSPSLNPILAASPSFISNQVCQAIVVKGSGTAWSQGR